MARKVVPNNSPVNTTAGRFKLAMSSLATFVFWLAVAILFPYPVLTPYWPAAVTWGPVVLYLLAFFNLMNGARHLLQAIRLQRPGRSVMPTAEANHPGREARNTPRSTREASPAKPRDNARDNRRASNMPQIRRAPTVQRMR